MDSSPDRLRRIVDRLRDDNLIPPVKSVEVVGGGIVRVIVSGSADTDLRVRLKSAMGSTRWKLVESGQ